MSNTYPPTPSLSTDWNPMQSTLETTVSQADLLPARIEKIERRLYFQTPVYRMHRIADGRVAWLMGMTHYALPEYYQQTVDMINEIQSGGGVVVGEGGGLERRSGRRQAARV